MEENIGQIQQVPVQNPINPTPIVPQAVPPKKTNKILLILVGILVVVGIGVGAFWLGRKSNKPSNNARLVTPTASGPTTTPDLNVDWIVYNNVYGFQFSYPPNYKLVYLDEGFSMDYPVLNRKIVWHVNNISYKDCSGDCPIITETSEKKLGTVSATKIKGWIGDVGGSVAQSFIGYEIKFPKENKYENKYVRMDLWELPVKLTPEEKKLYPPGRKINQVSSEEEIIFDQILSTFQFVTHEVAWKVYNGNGMEFMYPPEFKYDGRYIIFESPKIMIYSSPRMSDLLDECMKETSVEDRGNFIIKRFTGVTSGEICERTESTRREILVLPSTDIYAPGMSFWYFSTEGQQAELIFEQILSTFKFN